MGLENMKYDAFISYRHSEVDMNVAKAIQKKLENFKLPKALQNKVKFGKTKIERVFRDQDELPLSTNLGEPIEEALRNSDYLITICTPRYPESKWCAKEIEIFLKYHSREKILVVLADGEPSESFPESLCYDTKIVYDAEGNTREERIEIEPLAADTRGDSPKAVKKAIDDAVLRLSAQMFGLNYDDLKQRHKEQKNRKILTFVGLAASVCFAWGLVCMGLALRISHQKKDIADKNATLERQDKTLLENQEKLEADYQVISEQKDALVQKDELITEQIYAERLLHAKTMSDTATKLMGDCRRLDALYGLLQAMPKTLQDDDYPYTSETERALSDILGFYDTNTYFMPNNTFEVGSTPNSMFLSPDSKKLAVVTSSKKLCVYDVETAEKIAETDGCDEEADVLWLSEETLIFHSEKLSTYILNVASNQTSLISKESLLHFVLGTDQNVLYTIEENLNLCAFTFRAYANEQGYPLLYEIPLFEGSYRSVLCLESNLDGSLLSVIARDSQASVYTMYIIDALKQEVLLQKEIGHFAQFWDAVATNDSICVLVTENDETGKSNSVLYAYDWSTCAPLWKNLYPADYLSTVTYIDFGNPELLVDGKGVTYRIGTDGTQLDIIRFDNAVAGSFLSKTTTGYTRIISMKNGELWGYVSTMPDNIYDVTYSYFKYPPAGNVTGFLFNGSDLFMIYANENYVAHYKITSNQCSTDIALALPVESNYLYAYSDNYRYVVKTDINNQEGDSVVAAHVIYDNITGQSLCEKIADGQRYATFVGNSNSEFVTYGTEIRKYGINGNLLSTAPFPENCFNPTLSNDGTCLIFSSTSKETTGESSTMVTRFYVISLETMKESIQITFPNELGLKIPDLDATAGGKVVVYKSDCIELYEFGNSTAVNSLPFDKDTVSTFCLTPDGKYLFMSLRDSSLVIYDLPSLSTRTSYFNLPCTIRDIKYYPALDSYLLNILETKADGMRQPETIFLNKNGEYVRNIYDYVSYDPETKYFINPNKSVLQTVPYATYNELVQKAAEIVGDYVPSPYILSKYHIN